MENTGHNNSISRLVIRLFLVAYSALILLPMFWMVYTSFKTSGEFLESSISLPETLYIKNYLEAWSRCNMGVYLLNSTLIVAITLFCLVLLTTSTSYILARHRFMFSRLIENVYMASLLLPAIVGITPIFLVMRSMNLIDSRIGLIIILVASLLPFSVFVMIGFFKTIPKDYEEAAYIDGCSFFRTFWSIMMPMAKVGIVTICIFNFIYAWNDYVFSLILITSESKKTIQLGLSYVLEVQRYRTDWGALFAALVIVMIPTVFIYMIFQRRITEGLTVGGIKG